MARTLTTPIPQPPGVQQAIMGMRFEVPHVRNVGDTAMVIDKSQIQLRYEVITFDAAGLFVSRKGRVVKFPDWPASFVANVRSVYEKVMLDAESAGLIAGPGVDEALE